MMHTTFGTRDPRATGELDRLATGTFGRVWNDCTMEQRRALLQEITNTTGCTFHTWDQGRSHCTISGKRNPRCRTTCPNYEPRSREPMEK